MKSSSLRENIIKKYFGKHQKTAVSLLCVILVVIGEFSVDFAVKNISIVQDNRARIRDNEQIIGEMETSLNRNKDILQNIVTRNSFNSYIKRLDEERHNQVAINNKNSRDVGMLTGRLDVLENILYEHENKKNSG